MKCGGVSVVCRVTSWQQHKSRVYSVGNQEGGCMTTYVKWLTALEIGNEILDEQHKSLIQLINNISPSVGEQGLAWVMDELADYLFYHFAEEEDLLQRYRYHDLEEHKAEHQGFMVEVIRLTCEMETKRVDPDNVREYMLNWLINHIETADRKFSHLLN